MSIYISSGRAVMRQTWCPPRKQTLKSPRLSSRYGLYKPKQFLKYYVLSFTRRDWPGTARPRMTMTRMSRGRSPEYTTLHIPMLSQIVPTYYIFIFWLIVVKLCLTFESRIALSQRAWLHLLAKKSHYFSILNLCNKFNKYDILSDLPHSLASHSLRTTLPLSFLF